MTWAVRGISDVQELVDAELLDGTEVYSSFIDLELAAILLSPRQSPLKAWEEANPGKDAGQVTVGEVLDSWDETQGTDPTS